MKYCFRVTFINDSTKDYVPNDMANSSLLDYDKITFNKGFPAYKKKMAEAAGFYDADIKKVQIVKKTKDGKEITYNLINDNPYFEDILNNTYEKDILVNGHYEKKLIISSESESFQDMRNYVLKELNNNPDNFLNSVYTYDNNFKQLMATYVNAKRSANEYSEEDGHNLYELESLIREGVSHYDKYRTLATLRLKNDKKPTVTKVEEKPYEESKQEIENNLNNIDVDSFIESDIEEEEELPKYITNPAEYEEIYGTAYTKEEFKQMTNGGVIIR